MYRIIDNRASGKTSKLMLLAKENHVKIACSNPAAMRIKAHAYGITGVDFISYSDINLNEDNVMIDELENFVSYITKGKLTGYTLSNED